MQTITTPKGETLVVLPKEEYEALLDAVDIAIGDKARADLAAGRDELLPSAMVGRIIAGANPIRVWREHRGMSVGDLAAKTELSAADISEIEAGKKEGSVGTLKRIANALNVTLDDLV